MTHTRHCRKLSLGIILAFSHCLCRFVCKPLGSPEKEMIQPGLRQAQFGQRSDEVHGCQSLGRQSVSTTFRRQHLSGWVKVLRVESEVNDTRHDSPGLRFPRNYK